ncbi:MAG: DUF6036 family nucleotidyltransferase [Nitrosotalea sp.]
MSLDNTKLFEFLGEIDKELKRKIVVVAVGGTAITLFNAKASTIDVDFTIPGKYFGDFQHAKDIIQPGFKVDLFHDGAVFVNMLPEDYLKRSKLIKTRLKNIELRALHPVDIIVTKIGRLDGRDEQDIEACIKKFKIKKNQIAKRACQMGYAANDKVFQNHLQIVLKKFVQKEKSGIRLEKYGKKQRR